MTRYLVILCYIAAATWATCSLADTNSEPKAIEFKFTPRPGEVAKHRIVTKSVGTTQLMPPMPPMRFVQNVEQEIAFKCNKVNSDRSSIFDMTLHTMAFRWRMMGLNLSYDATTFDPAEVKHPINRCIGQIFSAINGSKVTGHFAPNGTLTKIVGTRATADRIISQLKKEMGNDRMSSMLMKEIEQMSAMFDDKTVTEQMKAFYRMVPNKQGPVRIGEKWEEHWDMLLPVFDVNCQGTGQYELVGIEKLNGRPCAKIQLKETFQITPNPHKDKSDKLGASQPFGGLLNQLDSTLTSSGGEGVAYWDYEDDVLVRIRQTQRMTLEFKFKTSPGQTTTSAPEGFGPMKQEFQTSVAVDLVEDDNQMGSQLIAPQTQPGNEK